MSRTWFARAGILAALAAIGAPARSEPVLQAAGPGASEPPRWSDHSILVRFDPASRAPARAAALASVRGTIAREFLAVPGLAHVLIDAPVLDAVATLAASPAVLYAEPDYIVRICKKPNDPKFRLQWGLHNTGQTIEGEPGTADADIDAPEAWDIFTGDPHLIIAVIDTGVDYTHPDLAANAWTNPGEIPANGIDDDANGYIDDIHGWDFFNEDADPMDDHSHGTFCAGIIGAVGNNGVGITGLNWRCRIMALKFVSADGLGYLSGAIAAIDYAVVNGAPVSNNSWGGYDYFESLDDAIGSAGAAGHLFVAASGNDGNDNDATPFYPASYEHDNVLAVGGLDNDGLMPDWANYGAHSVDLIAPAASVHSAWLGGYAYGSGTSAAAPHAAGVAALLLGLHPDWTATQARACILSNVRQVPALSGRVSTGGILNAAQALRRSPRPAANK